MTDNVLPFNLKAARNVVAQRSDELLDQLGAIERETCDADTKVKNAAAVLTKADPLANAIVTLSLLAEIRDLEEKVAEQAGLLQKIAGEFVRGERE